MAGNGQVKPQYEVFSVPPISVGGGLNDIHPMRRGGVKSIVDDFVLGRGVVISRAATSLRSVETQPLTRRFVRTRRTYLRFKVKYELSRLSSTDVSYLSNRSAGSTPAPGFI